MNRNRSPNLKAKSSHRAYQSVRPTANRILTEKWDNIVHQLHRDRVENAKGFIDNKPPPTYMHLHYNYKKLQQAEERMAKVERDNRILMEKMSYVMRMKDGHGADNHHDYEMYSLNVLQRRRELLRLTLENQAMLRRLCYNKPHYNHKELEAQWKVNLKYMENAAKYPLHFLVEKRPKQSLSAPGGRSRPKDKSSLPAVHSM